MNSNILKEICNNVLQNSSLVPRLDYSLVLLDSIIESLKQAKTEVQNSTRAMLENSVNDNVLEQALAEEKTVCFSLELLCQIKKRSSMICNIMDIPKTMAYAVIIMRTISACLHELSPTSSRKLSELSVHLGSIVLDSATLTKAQFDFNNLNYEAEALLDKVKLMVDSKIDKQYPNLEILKQ